MANWSNLAGSVLGYIRLGLTGVRLKNSSGTLAVRNAGDSADAPINTSGITGLTTPLSAGQGGTGLTTPGTSGNVLTSNGTAWVSSPPGGGGALVYLSTVTASAAATVDVETGFSATYDHYLVVFSTTQSDTAVNFRALLKIGGAYATSGYNDFVGISVTGFANTSEQTAYIPINNNGGNAAGYSTSGQVRLFNVNSTSLQKLIDWNGVTISGADALTSLMGAARNTGTAALSGIRFFAGTGTLTGTFKLYGIAKG